MIKRETKHYLILSFILFLIFAFGTKLLAQSQVEVSYPTIERATAPTSPFTPLVNYLKYVYNFGITVVGVILFALFVKGGIKYFTSTGNPARMKDAKEDINKALLGILIVFSSYLILNTINPQLVIFPVFNIQPISPTTTSPFGVPTSTRIYFKEVPVGTLITSEFSLSSFIATTSPPEICAPSTSTTSTIACKYSTDFEGALYGERLQRIHEVASTTLPVVDMLATLSGELVDVMKELKEADQKLYQYAMECSCIYCSCVGCGIPKVGPCSCPKCSGDPCPHREEMNDLRENIIPSFYENEDDPIPCRMAQIEYLGGAFEAFLNDHSNLVKNEDHQDRSYWYSDEAEELREKIENCIASGEITQERYDEIENLIQSMANVENKGTHTPETDPPERDVESNLDHLLAIIEEMKKVKDQLNPYSQQEGSLTYLPRSAISTFEAATQYEIVIVKARLENNELVRVIEDPTTFYVLSLPEPGREEELPFHLTRQNVVFAQDEQHYGPPPSTCTRVVEIPVGTVLDKSIELASEIWAELFNIYYQGHYIIDRLEEQNELATSTAQQLSKKLIDLTSEDNCISKCQDVPCEPHCINIEITTPAGKVSGHICLPPCSGSHPCTTIGEISQTWGEIAMNVAKIEALYNKILDAQKSIHKSFCKLDSGTDPDTGDPCTIDSDFCCENTDGNCRDNAGNLEVDEIEERKYTLKERLIEIQKILNRTREVLNEDEADFGGRSAYEILLDQLIELGLAQPQEKRIIPEEKFDLGNCQVRYVQVQEGGEALEQGTDLLNCKVARGEVSEYLYDAIRKYDPELCNPDPLLDCDYFNPASERYWNPSTRSREGAQLSCYCYDPEIDSKNYRNSWFPEILRDKLVLQDWIRSAKLSTSDIGASRSATTRTRVFSSNLFCCVNPQEPE